MFGLIIGLGVGVLIGKVAARRRFGPGFGGRGHHHQRRWCHHRGWEHHHHGHQPPPWGGQGRGLGFGPFSFWRDAPPPVRDAFKDAMYEVKRNAQDARSVFGDLATAFEQDNFAVNDMGESIERVRSAAEEASTAFVGALAKVHPDMSRRERAEIADMLRRLR